MLFTCVELPDVLPVLQERPQLRRQAVALQAVLQPQLRNGLVPWALGVTLAALLQADELERDVRHRLRQAEARRGAGLVLPHGFGPLDNSSFPVPVTVSGKEGTSQQLPSDQGGKSTRQEQRFKGQPVTKVL